MESHTHIIKWTDGEATWSMTIQAGSVEIKTADATKSDAAAALSAEWTRLMGFATLPLSDSNTFNDRK